MPPTPHKSGDDKVHQQRVPRWKPDHYRALGPLRVSSVSAEFQLARKLVESTTILLWKVTRFGCEGTAVTVTRRGKLCTALLLLPWQRAAKAGHSSTMGATFYWLGQSWAESLGSALFKALKMPPSLSLSLSLTANVGVSQCICCAGAQFDFTSSLQLTSSSSFAFMCFGAVAVPQDLELPVLLVSSRCEAVSV